MVVVFRRGLLFFALISIAICVVLLLNFTAPNPTGRRYSSEIPVTTGQAAVQQIGRSGEYVLSKDLRLPSNDNDDQLQCVCRDASYTSANQCRVCFAHVPALESTHRRPDFVGNDFIAESKNSQNLMYSGREVDQITGFASAARLLRFKLWVYVRVNTQVDPQFAQIVEATGGGIVYYFAVPGYVDPVDQAADAGLFAAVPLMLFMGVLELRNRRKPRLIVVPARPAKPNPTDKADDAADFVRRAKAKAQRRIDIDEEYIDL